MSESSTVVYTGAVPPSAGCPLGLAEGGTGPLPSPLGTYSKYVTDSGLIPDSLPSSTPSPNPSRYLLLSGTRNSLKGEVTTKGKPFGVVFCMRTLPPGALYADLYRDPVKLRGRFKNVLTCGSVWLCPVCSGHIAEGRRKQIARCLEAHKVAGGQVLFVTRTGSHTAHESIALCLQRFRKAERLMSQRYGYTALKARYGVVGTVTVLEVTYKLASGWHVHTHTLLFLERPLASLDGICDDLWAVWASGAKSAGLGVNRSHGLTVKDTYDDVQDYVSKYGRLPSVPGWGIDNEMTKGHVKIGRDQAGLVPFQLLMGDDENLRARFVEYAHAFHGRRRLVFSDGLLARLDPGSADVSDEELAAVPGPEWEYFDSLSEEEFKAVCYAEAHEEVLYLVGLGDLGAVRQCVNKLVQRYAFMSAGYAVRDLAKEVKHAEYMQKRKDSRDSTPGKEGSTEVDRELRIDLAAVQLGDGGYDF